MITKQARLGPLLALLTLLAAGLLAATPARAHVGNKDVFEQVSTGPYTLFITLRPPLVIPGVATVEVRVAGPAVTSLRMAPMMLTGEASKHPPTSDTLTRSPDDASFYTGSVWLMESGSWQVRFEINGPQGPSTISVPVAAAPLAVLPMQHVLGTLLALLGALLVVGAAGIVAAATREGRLRPGVAPDTARTRRALIAGSFTLVLMITAVWLGGKWWNVEAAGYATGLYRASEMRPVLTGDLLTLTIGDPDKDADGGWKAVKTSLLLPDHGHLMHLYAIRTPAMDAAFHLHPEASGNAGLTERLPVMPPGTYKLFADIVYANGFPETETATLTIPPTLHGTPLAPEDASAAPPPLAAGELGTSYKLPGGDTMVWQKPASIAAHRAYAFQFTLLDATGKPATDIQPYLGMAGHAAFVKTDFSAFAHTHPEGSAAMPAMMLANGGEAAMDGMASNDAPARLPPTVSFPYGFPSPGCYRIFVQMKHAGTVETGVFDAEVR